MEERNTLFPLLFALVEVARTYFEVRFIQAEIGMGQFEERNNYDGACLGVPYEEKESRSSLYRPPNPDREAPSMK